MVAMLSAGGTSVAEPPTPPPPSAPPWIGAAPERSGPAPPGRTVAVASQDGLRAAAAAAQPGTVLEFAPGRYRFTGAQITLAQPGTPDAPIVLRAARLGDVTIEADQVTVLKLVAPQWRIENLVVRGVCADHGDCEHAVHVVAGARGIIIRNNRFTDFNAQIKVNGETGAWPDDGVIAGNTLRNTTPRRTDNPITPIDVVGASRWRIEANLIADFVRAGGGRATYGAFVKGGGQGNVMHRNIVLCEWGLRGLPGERVGLSLGGGGTGPSMRRGIGGDGREQTEGVIRDNLIAFCSDVGVYVNRGDASTVAFNTLLGTAGIDVRFPESVAVVAGNLLDGAIRARNGGQIRALGNLAGQRVAWRLFADPAALDLRWRTPPAPVDVAVPRAPSGDRPSASGPTENGTNPNGTNPDGTNPVGMNPGGVDARPAGRAPVGGNAIGPSDAGMNRTDVGTGDRWTDLCGVPRPVAPLPGAFEDWARCQ